MSTYQPRSGETLIVEPLPADLSNLWHAGRAMNTEAQTLGTRALANVSTTGNLADAIEQLGHYADMVRVKAAAARGHEPERTLFASFSMKQAAESVREAFFNLAYARYQTAAAFNGLGIRELPGGNRLALVGLADGFDYSNTNDNPSED